MALKLNSVGGGVVTIDTPNTANNYTLTAPAATGKMMVSPQTLTVPDTTGTVMVSGAMPAFSAYAGAVTSLANNAFTKTLFNTEEFDTNSNYDTSTSRFTPTVAGYYQVNAAVSFAAMTSGAAFIQIYKNGTGYKYGQLFSGTSAGTLANIGALVYLNGSTDYIEIYAYQASGASKNSVNAATDTYFQASLVRAA